MLSEHGDIRIIYCSLKSEPRKNSRLIKRAIQVTFDKEYVIGFLKHKFKEFTKDDLIRLIKELTYEE